MQQHQEPTIRGDRLRARRQELGLTQEQVAERAETKQSTISQLERSAQVPTLRSLVGLAQALGTSMEWLLGMTDDVQPVVSDEAGLDALEREAIALLRASDPVQRSDILAIMRAIVALALRHGR